MQVLLLVFCVALPRVLAIPSFNPLSITPKAIPASGNVSVFISVPRSDVDPALSLFLHHDPYSVTLLFLPGTVLPVPPRNRLQITVPCSVHNLTHVVFTPPPFSNSEVTFQVTALYTKGKSPIALLRVPNVPCVLQVFSYVTGRSGSTNCSAAGPCRIEFQGYGFNTDVNQYRCTLTSSDGSWMQASSYSTAESLQGGLQQVVCSMGKVIGHGEAVLQLGLQ
jgi:hypothetical protein